MVQKSFADLKAQMPIGVDGAISAQDIHDIVDTIEARTIGRALVKTGNYTAAADDDGATLVFTSATTSTLTLPASLPAGWCCDVLQAATGQVGVTVLGGSLLHVSNHTFTAAQYALARLLVVANDGTAPQVIFRGNTTASVAMALDHDFATTKTLPSNTVFARATTGTYFNNLGVRATAPIDQPRFDHDPSVSNASLGLLIEPDAVIFPNNRNPSAWLNDAGALTFTAASGTALDGTNSLVKVEKGAANSALVNGFLLSRFATVTLSAYVKRGDFDIVYLQFENSNFSALASAQFNLANGTVNSGPGSIKAMGNGIYRIAVTAQTGIFKWGYLRLGLANSNTSGFFLFDGAQADVGATPTSFYPTTGFTARRPDVLDVSLPTGSYDLLVRYPTGGDWLLGRPSEDNVCRVGLRHGKTHLSRITAWTAGSLTQMQRDEIFVSDAVPAVQSQAFADEFTSLSLDVAENGSNNWVTRFVGWNTAVTSGNNDLCYKTHSGFVGGGSSALGVTLHEVSGGVLKLSAMPTPVGKEANVDSFPYVGGMISSELRHAQVYGYWEVRARFAVTKGQHWSMYMLSTDEQWPPEIDMVEIAGWENTTGSTLVTMNFHGAPGEISNASQVIFAPTSGPGNWHTYGFYWDQYDMIWYFDGVEKLRRPNFISKPMYFLMTPEMASNWPGQPNETTVWPSTCEVEYVRVDKFA